MISFQNFDQWQSVAGFAMVAFFGLLYPLFGEKSAIFKVIFLAGVILAIVIPFTVIVEQDAQDRLTTRMGKMVHCLTFILLFYSYVHKEILQKHFRYFFWFSYALGWYSLFELLCLDVLFSSKFQFVNVLFPWLNTHFGVENLIFTSPLSYLIKFIFLGLFFQDSLQSTTWKKIFQYLIWILVVVELVQVLVFKSYQGYDSLSSTIKNLFTLGGAGLLLYKVYSTPNINIHLQKNPYFWICLGLILPALAELFLEFIFTKLYETDIASFYKLYLVRNASQIVGFTLLIVGVWQSNYLRFVPKEY